MQAMPIEAFLDRWESGNLRLAAWHDVRNSQGTWTPPVVCGRNASKT